MGSYCLNIAHQTFWIPKDMLVNPLQDIALYRSIQLKFCQIGIVDMTLTGRLSA
jgi:hypothetical protein